MFLLTCFKAYPQAWVYVGTPKFSDGAATHTQIAIDTAGIPYVSYLDYANYSRVTVKKYNGSVWQNVGVPAFSDTTGDNAPAIALDKAGTPYVAFISAESTPANGRITVMKFDGTSWVVVGIPGFSLGAVEEVFIALDRADTPYVAYTNRSMGTPRPSVMKFNGSSWVSVGPPIISPEYINSLSFALDSAGTPYIAYSKFYSDDRLVVLKYDGTSWVPLELWIPVTGVHFTSVAIGNGNVPHVAFDYRAKKYNGISWDDVGDAYLMSGYAWSLKLAFDKNGTPYIAYTSNQLLPGFYISKNGTSVKKYDGSEWVPVGNLDFSPGYAQTVSIDLGANETPYVAFHDLSKDPGHTNGVTVMRFDTTIAPTTGLSFKCVGDTAKLINATTGGTWSSSNAAIAMIDGDGLVTCLAEGSATIYYSKAGLCTPFSMIIDSCTTNVGNISTPSSTVDLYPNPAIDNITLRINMPQHEDVEVVIVDVLGRKLLATSIQTNTDAKISLHLSSGCYYMHATTSMGPVQRSLIIQ